MIPKNPGCTADLIVPHEGKIVLIKRKNEPYKGFWALPGGFLEYGRESVEETGIRELEEETGLIARVEDLVLIGVYSKPGRDPRGHVVSHVYLVKKFEGRLRAGDDAEDFDLFHVNNLPKLAFDHEEIIKDYCKYKSDGIYK